MKVNFEGFLLKTIENKLSQGKTQVLGKILFG